MEQTGNEGISLISSHDFIRNFGSKVPRPILYNYSKVASNVTITLFTRTIEKIKKSMNFVNDRFL